MKNIKILDCTLRDGGRIINCAFPNEHIIDISKRLSEAELDIVEVGFLRDAKKVTYTGNSTFFTDVDQIRPFIDKHRSNTLYVAFIDYGLFDFDSLKPYDGTSLDGIRVGFVKKDIIESYDDLVQCLKAVKHKGYKLFIQGVNSLGYSDKELLDIVEMVNEIEPYSFGIVDTYGAMYSEDVHRIYNLIDHNLKKEVCINFHSHNNFQLSFSFAQEIIKLSEGIRRIIIDATLNGMGKCAGNLNTELIVDYLNRKLFYNYDFDSILDIIDDYISVIGKTHSWGYSIPAVMAGIYKSHPNNIIYLTEKFRLQTKDIKYILSMITPEIRQRYDYENIQKLYANYNHTKVNDKTNITELKELLSDKKILLMFPGESLNTNKGNIQEYIEKNNPFIITVNFFYDDMLIPNIAFFGSEKRYKAYSLKKNNRKAIIVSNIKSDNNEDYILNYESLIERGNEEFDNTAIMLLNFLKKINITKFAIAGFDGYDASKKNYFDSINFNEERFKDKYITKNSNMIAMLKHYTEGLEKREDIYFVTPSQYSYIFE